MNLRQIDIFQPEQKLNNEPQPIVSTSPPAIGNTNVSSRFDLEEQPCYNGHITVDAFNCLCGYKYVYYGILSRSERISFPRASNNYLKYTTLKDVECEVCKKIKYEQLSS